MPAPTLPTYFWLDLLGKPFEEDARGPRAYDCVGLVLEISRRHGLPVGEYQSREPDLISALATWEHAAVPLPGDAILFRSIAPRWHVGVVAGDGWMIHTQPGTGVVRERYNSFPWHNRIEGFYRWKKLGSLS